MTDFFARLKELKHKEIIIAVIAVAVMLIIYFSSFGGSRKPQQTEVEATDYCALIKREITSAVSKMDGVGSTEVVINWSSSVEVVTDRNVTVNGNSTSSQVVQSSGSPVVVKEVYPKAVGVLVVCEGGSNAKIKIDIIMAISTLLDVSPEKVLVFEMN